MIVVDFPSKTSCARADALRHALKIATTLLADPMRLTLTAADVAVLTAHGGLGRRGPVGGASGSPQAADNLNAERDASQAPFRFFVVVAYRGRTKDLQVFGSHTVQRKKNAAIPRHSFVSSGEWIRTTDLRVMSRALRVLGFGLRASLCA
jgi:hypothetical protein